MTRGWRQGCSVHVDYHGWIMSCRDIQKEKSLLQGFVAYRIFSFLIECYIRFLFGEARLDVSFIYRIPGVASKKVNRQGFSFGVDYVLM